MAPFDGPNWILDGLRRHPFRVILAVLILAGGIYGGAYLKKRGELDAQGRDGPNRPQAEALGGTRASGTQEEAGADSSGVRVPTTGPTTAVNPILCRDPVDRRPVSPPGFDAGYRDPCRAYLYINDDEICDYCRTVGDRNQLRCTLGTPTGLNGLQSDAIHLEGNAPYPDTCEWIDYQGTKIPALRGEIGNNHESISITTVKMSTDAKQIVIGPTQSLPNIK